MKDRNTIIEKIRRLREMTEENGASQAEAELFAAKAAKMMADHAVAESEITNPPEHQLSEHEIKYLNPWRRELLEAIGRACFVTIVYVVGTNRINLVGRPLNVRSFMEMFRFIERQCVEIARQLFPGSHQLKAQRRAEGGLAVGVAQKLMEHNRANAESRLPVVQEMKKAREATLNFVPDLQPMEDPEHKITEEWGQGFLHADRIKLREDIGG